MADEENDIKTGNEKPEEKEEPVDSGANETTEKETPPDTGSSSTVVKEEEKSPKKENKSPKKETNVKKDEKSDSEGDDSEGEDEKDLPPGLLELPLEVEGKREKKKVERLSASMIRSPQEKKKVEIEEGSGVKLGDIPYVEHQLTVTKAIDLKPLHRVLFQRQGTNNEIKKNIRQFCGFSHDKESKEYEKRTAVLNKMVLAELKTLCLTLGLERNGTKPNLVERVMDFLTKPEDKGLSIKTKAKKRSKSAGGKKKGPKRKRKSKGTAKKEKSTKNEDNSEIDDSADEDDDEEEEEEEEAEESEDEVPKKKAKVENKKKTTPKAAKENGKKEKASAKKEPKKSPAKKKPAPVASDPDVSDSLSDSDDEPIAKIKKSPPSNDEIKDLVKKFLEGADLETVTMKTVVKQVYAKYPSFDLSDRKDFIKDTVREVIS